MFAKYSEILTSRRFYQVVVIAFVQFLQSVGWIEGVMAEAIVSFITTVLGVSVGLDTLDKAAKRIGGK